jgi:hypothetical protein
MIRGGNDFWQTLFSISFREHRLPLQI